MLDMLPRPGLWFLGNVLIILGAVTGTYSRLICAIHTEFQQGRLFVGSGGSSDAVQILSATVAVTAALVLNVGWLACCLWLRRKRPNEPAL